MCKYIYIYLCVCVCRGRASIYATVSCSFFRVVLYQVEEVSFYSQIEKNFTMHNCWILSNKFSASIDIII